MEEEALPRIWTSNCHRSSTSPVSLEIMAITSFEIFPSFSHPAVQSVRKGSYIGSWVRTTQLAHDPLDVTLDLIICGDQHIETILLHDFEVFCGIYPPLVENATTQTSVGNLKAP